MIGSGSDIAVHVRQYIVENFLYVRPDHRFTDTDPLFGQGIIDSFGATELIAHLEERYGIVIEDREVTEEHLGSITAIARFVSDKLATASGASAA
jgi:acyl carrier protein